MIWLTMDGSAYIHSKRLISCVSNSLVRSICCIQKKAFVSVFNNEGAKVRKKQVSNPKHLRIFAASLPNAEKQLK